MVNVSPGAIPRSDERAQEREFTMENMLHAVFTLHMAREQHERDRRARPRVLTTDPPPRGEWLPEAA